MCPDLTQLLRERLQGPLPGRRAQRPFAPELAYGRHAGPPAYDAKAAAVIVFLYPVHGEWHVPLTLRPASMAAHAGQVSFPGGVIEAGETPEQAAVRELQEELNVPPASVECIGRLTPLYVFGSNFWVTPIVAVAKARPEFEPHADEVAELLEAPLGELIDPAWHRAHWIERGSLCFRTPHIECEGQRIWGATCMILAEFLAVVADCNCRSTAAPGA